MESNTGKELYNTDGLRIVLASVDQVGIQQGGGYNILFRSHGTYNIDQAVLISGNKHYSTESRWFSSTNDVIIRSEYEGEEYEGSLTGISGLNDKDGDGFSFYIPPSLDEQGTVKLVVSNLSVNRWHRK